jgi:cobalamin biosynthesis protein CbiG
MGARQTVSRRRAVGFGCSSAASVDDVVALLRASIGAVTDGTCLATLDRREAIAREVAAALKIELVLFPAAVLAQVHAIVTPSLRAAALTGTPSVAEAAALIAVGPSARLVIPRRTGRRCTCALAESS